MLVVHSCACQKCEAFMLNKRKKKQKNMSTLFWRPCFLTLSFDDIGCLTTWLIVTAMLFT